MDRLLLLLLGILRSVCRSRTDLMDLVQVRPILARAMTLLCQRQRHGLGDQQVDPAARATDRLALVRAAREPRDPEEVLALARRGQEVAKPTDVIKDPFVLEFLDLREPAELRERDVEQAIIDRLETFLLEMGKGFCFVGRQKRLTVEGDHFYVDLVFYNRLIGEILRAILDRDRPRHLR
jgi:hypothetical protein